MRKQIVKEFITIKKVRYLPPEPPEPPPPPPPPKKWCLAVGSCTMDMITIVNNRLVPGQVARTTDGSWRRGGPAANICTVWRRLGLECEFLGVLSRSRAFESLRHSFQSDNIDISNCPMTYHHPPHRSIIVQRNTDFRTVLEFADKRQELTYQQFVGAVDYQNYLWIHFEMRLPEQVRKMIMAVRAYNERCPESKIIISTDVDNLNPENMLAASMADYVFIRKACMHKYAYVNGRETVCAAKEKMVFERKKYEKSLPPKNPYVLPDEPTEDELCQPEESNQPHIMYNNFQDGASCLMKDDTFIKVAAQTPSEMVDVNGHSDTFTASVIYALLVVKMSLRDALEYGARASALKVTAEGFDVLRCMPKDLVKCYYA
ncbi:uncharacterized protein Dana_GF24487 [Drosophila ananassae]|uniref:Carbohydrate kinase PfkB domain-containing protein n=1 Tax=Drosophila ananassae TaxID=7217 RepID=B3M4P3_DROAN|nr:ketohexokinase [Drosophila ananassae]EDV39442.1 uncharacterized protein Dana_GF24487 [Drosophila ananassae]